MKVEGKKLGNFLKKVGMDSIIKAVLSFEKNGLRMKVAADSMTHMSEGFFDSSKFEVYDYEGQIAVDNYDKLVKIILSAKDKIDLEVKNNLLVISLDAYTKLYVELIEKDYIVVPPEIKNIDYSVNFEIPAEQLNAFLKQVVAYNKDFSIIFETTKNGIKISNTGKFKFERIINVTGLKTGVKVKFGQPLMTALNNVNDGLLKISYDEDAPMKIENVTENEKVVFYIAPTTDA